MKNKQLIKKLISEEKIKKRITGLAKEISSHIKSKNIKDLHIICLLKGSFIFSADLIRELHRNNISPRVDFISISSYGSKKQSSGKIKINGKLSESVMGKDVLLVDDILESGRTIHYMKAMLIKKGAKRIMTAVLLHKKDKLVKKVKADFSGFIIEDKFVVGYGLDFAGNYRELPFIGEIID